MPHPYFSPVRCLARGLGRVPVDSDHAECYISGVWEHMLIVLTDVLSVIMIGQWLVSFVLQTSVTASKLPFVTRQTTGSRLTIWQPAMSSIQMMVQPIDFHFLLIYRNVSPLVAGLNLPSAMMQATLSSHFGTIITGTITALSVMLVQCPRVILTLPGCIFYKLVIR